jgi:hypothetical protein
VPEDSLFVGGQDLESQQVKFADEGAAIVGRFLGFSEVEMTDDEGNPGETANKYMMDVAAEGKEPERYWFWGSYLLDQKLPKVPQGAAIMVKYEYGEDIGGGRTLKHYNVVPLDWQDFLARARAQGLVSEGEKTPF